MTNEPYAILRRFGDKAVVYEACFLPNARASHAVHFVTTGGVHAYVDVSDGDPVALTLVHSPSAGVEYRQADKGTPDFLKSAFRLAARLIVLDDGMPPAGREPANGLSRTRFQIGCLFHFSYEGDPGAAFVSR